MPLPVQELSRSEAPLLTREPPLSSHHPAPGPFGAVAAVGALGQEALQSSAVFGTISKMTV